MILAGLSDFIVGDLTDWVLRVIDAIGYVGVAFLVAIESVFPPIPSEIVLPAAGFSAGQGESNLIGMIVAATAGSVIGAWVLYALAALFGHDRLEAITIRYGRWLGVKPRDLHRAEAWFDDHSQMAVLICRCVPLIRSLVSIPAGLRRMRPATFTIYTTLGSLVWNVLLIGAGYQLGGNWDRVADYVSILQYVVVAVILIGLAWWVWIRLLSPTHRARRAAEEAEIEAAQPYAEALLEGDDTTGLPHPDFD